MTAIGAAGELHFTLSKPLTFMNLEDQQKDDQTFEVIFRGPTYRELHYAGRLEQAIYQAFRNAQTDRASMAAGDDMSDEEKALLLAEKAEASDDDDDDETMTAARVWTLLAMYSSDLSQVLKDFEKLAVEVGKINDATPLTLKMYRSLSVDDIRRMCSEYLAFFIGRSVVSTMRGLT